MALDTNLNVSPYFSDYTSKSGYNSILFGAGRTIQTRELNNLQAQLQNQIEQFGRNIFQEGALVIPGGITVSTSQPYATFSFSSGSNYASIANIPNLYIKSNTTGLIAAVSDLTNATNSNPATMFTDITNSGTGQQNTFVNGEACTIFTYNSDGSVNNVALVNIIGTGLGSFASVQSGVYFIRGNFVYTPDQTYVINPYATNISARIGFNVTESIVTAAQDASLYSNANGYPNVNSRGADRLQVTLTLTAIGLTDTNLNFVELARLENGVLQSTVAASQYSLIQDSIAQRTFETNGNYTVVPFGLAINESLNTGTNGGIYTAAQGGTESQFVASVKPGIAYVSGYRVDNIGIDNISINKARSTAFLDNAVASSDYGPYFLANNTLSLPDINITNEIQLLDNTATMVGYCRIRAVRYVNSQYRFYVFDINFNVGKSVSNVTSLKYSDSSNLFSATLVSSVLYNSNLDSLVFPLPVSSVQTLEVQGQANTSYTVMRSFNLMTNAAGVASASVGVNEVFAPVDPSVYFIVATGATNNGTVFNSNSITLGGTIVGTSLTINLGATYASTSIKLLAPVIKSAPTMRSKTLVTVTNELVNFPATTTQKLANADVYKIISIVDTTTGQDVTSLFTLDNGMRPSYYQVGALNTVGSQLIIRTLHVTYQYFSHTAGDYFCVDSYQGINRTNMPTYNGYNLADCIDFRPTKDSNGNLTNLTVNGEIVKPADTIRANITYYLPRNDLICVDETGKFFDVTGISSLSPTYPAVPANSMALYQLEIPAYTSYASDITVHQLSNTVYTMKDIGALDTRIGNLEYYTSLSLLESKAANTQITDPTTGLPAFKNGIAVDGFNSYALCDLLNPQFSASLDLNANTLNASFTQNGVNFTPASLTGTQVGKDVFVNTFTENSLVIQPLATTTININPYSLFNWVGTVSLSPNQDFWNDVYFNPPVVVNNVINLEGPNINSLVWTGWWKTTHQANPVGNHADWSRLQYENDLVQTSTKVNTSPTQTTTTQSITTSIIPYMRSINVAFNCVGFRPFTQIYPFFDSVAITPYCYPTGGAYGQAIITDAHGQASGIFTIPCTSTVNFTTGTSVFRFSDSPTNSTDENVITTWGSTTFESGSTATAINTLTTNTVTLTTTTTSKIVQSTYIDPVANTFIIPNGGDAFVSSVDIFFATKALSIPVTVQVRTVETGLPTNIIVAQTTLNPSSVNVSNDGSVGTRFEFADPVYMQAGVQYAIVVISNTTEYNIYIATVGEAVIGAQYALSSQANVGVFLTSSNGSTWNPDQTSQMKFNVNQALFNTSQTSILFNCTAPVAVPVSFNALSTVSGSPVITCQMKNHGLISGDTATISGAIAGNNISSADLNKTVTVISSTLNSFTFNASTNANLTGSLGGSGIMVQANYPFALFNANVNAYAPPNTSITWSYQYKAQQNRALSGFTVFDINNDVYLPNQAVITQAGDLQLLATFNTSKATMSPCIDVSGLGVIAIAPQIDRVQQVFNYVSVPILFNNPCTSATFYISASLPNLSNMQFYIKPIDNTNEDLTNVAWIPLNPTTPIANSLNFVEYKYLYQGNFVGYKVMISFTGDPTMLPICNEFRSIALA